MVNILQQLRSRLNGKPSSLIWGQLAWSDLTEELYIGKEDESVVAIAGANFLPPDIILSAAENLVSGMMVNFFVTGGQLKARRADASLGIAGAVHGYVQANFAINTQAAIYTRKGAIARVAGLELDTRYYLSDALPGAMTAVPIETTGHILQFIGNSITNGVQFQASDPIIRL